MRPALYGVAMPDETTPAERAWRRRAAGKVAFWFAAVAALLAIAAYRDLLGPVLTLFAGLIAFSVGAAFVAAPLVRRRLGKRAAGDERLWRKRSFVLGLIVLLLGAAVTGLGLWDVVQRALEHAHSTSS